MGLLTAVAPIIILKRGMSRILEGVLGHCIVPDVLDRVPRDVLEAKFPSGAFVDLGNVLTPTQVKSPPKFKFPGDYGTLYTFCLVDPDAPSRKEPTLREWLHWLVGNVPFDRVVDGQVLAQYISSAPPKDTGLHRYVFLIYKQPEKICFREKVLTNDTAEGRDKFSIKKFAAKYKLGDPEFINFYQAEYDDYVALIYKGLKKPEEK